MSIKWNDLSDIIEISKAVSFISAPTISDFTSSGHDHEDVAGGGILTLQNQGSGAALVGKLMESDGSGNWTLIDTPVAGFTPAIAQTYYVDGAREDTYTETGTEAKPYKDIQSAIDAVEALGDSSATNPYTIFIKNNRYLLSADLVIARSGISLVGESRLGTIIRTERYNVRISSSAGTAVSIQNLTIYSAYGALNTFLLEVSGGASVTGGGSFLLNNVDITYYGSGGSSFLGGVYLNQNGGHFRIENSRIWVETGSSFGTETAGVMIDYEASSLEMRNFAINIVTDDQTPQISGIRLKNFDDYFGKPTSVGASINSGTITVKSTAYSTYAAANYLAGVYCDSTSGTVVRNVQMNGVNFDVQLGGNSTTATCYDFLFKTDSTDQTILRTSGCTLRSRDADVSPAGSIGYAAYISPKDTWYSSGDNFDVDQILHDDKDSGGNGVVLIESQESLPVVEVSATTHVVTPDQGHIFVGHTATAAVAVTIDDDNLVVGRRIKFVDTGGNAGTNNITIQDETPTTIYTIDSDGGSVSLYWDGSSWIVENKIAASAGGDAFVPALAQTVYVDGARGDSYTPDGTEAKPYLTIDAALSSITDAATDKRYTIFVKPFEYVISSNLNMKSYVSLVGESRRSTILNFNGQRYIGLNDKHYVEISNCTLKTTAVSVSYLVSLYNSIGTQLRELNVEVTSDDAGFDIFDIGGFQERTVILDDIHITTAYTGSLTVPARSCFRINNSSATVYMSNIYADMDTGTAPYPNVSPVYIENCAAVHIRDSILLAHGGSMNDTSSTREITGIRAASTSTGLVTLNGVDIRLTGGISSGNGTLICISSDGDASAPEFRSTGCRFSARYNSAGSGTGYAAAIDYGSSWISTGDTLDTDDILNDNFFGSGNGLVKITDQDSLPMTPVDATTYNILQDDGLVNVTHTATAAVAVTLATDNVWKGRRVKILDGGSNASTNNITIGTEGAATIAGSATYVIDTDDGSVTLYCDGTNWLIENKIAASAGGDVSSSGTPVNNQLAVWTDASTIEGDSGLIWDGINLVIYDSGDVLFATIKQDSSNGTIISNNNGPIVLNGSGGGRTGTTGTPSFALLPGDFFIEADLEVDGVSNFAGVATFTSAPVISDFTSSGHDHSDAANGGQIDYSDILNTPAAGSGNVSSSGTPVDNQIAVWTDASTIEGDSGLLWTGTTLTNSSGVMSIRPASSYLRIGTASTSTHSLGTDDLLVTDSLEVDGSAFFDSAAYFYSSASFVSSAIFSLYSRHSDSVEAYFGSGNDASLTYSTGQGTDLNAMIFGLPDGGTDNSRNLILCDKTDFNTAWGHAASSNPTLYIQSNTTTAGANLSLYHDSIDANIKTGSGRLTLDPASYVRVGIGITSHSLGHDDLFVTGDAEVNGTLYADGPAIFYSGLYTISSVFERGIALVNTASYTVPTASSIVTVSYSAGACQIDLTNFSGVIGSRLSIVKTHGATNTISFSNYNTIRGSSGFSFSGAYESIIMVEIDGSGNWAIIGRTY